MLKVICIGNRFAYPDNFGMIIYEKLKKLNLPDTEIIEGGVGGFSLMPYFEDKSKILIIDYGTYEKNILTQEDIKQLEITEFNHANAFLYLLKTVQKPYTIYICNKDFNEQDIKIHLKKITELIKVLNGNN